MCFFMKNNNFGWVFFSVQQVYQCWISRRILCQVYFSFWEICEHWAPSDAVSRLAPSESEIPKDARTDAHLWSDIIRVMKVENRQQHLHEGINYINLIKYWTPLCFNGTGLFVTTSLTLMLPVYPVCSARKLFWALLHAPFYPLHARLLFGCGTSLGWVCCQLRGATLITFGALQTPSMLLVVPARLGNQPRESKTSSHFVRQKTPHFETPVITSPLLELRAACQNCSRVILWIPARECQIHNAKGPRPSIWGSVISFSAKPEIKALDGPFLCQR